MAVAMLYGKGSVVILIAMTVKVLQWMNGYSNAVMAMAIAMAKAIW